MFILSSGWGMNGVCQNLVVNPGFENFSTCPHSVGEVYKCSGWSSFGYTSDYFNACDTAIVDVPYNLFGNQSAYNGNSFCGFYNYGNNNYREYIGSKLIDSLVINTTYYISAWVSLADRQQYGCPSNNVGFLFSNEQYFDSIPVQTNNFAHFHLTQIISDSTNWTMIKGLFIADSNYKYVIIGNFFDNINTDTLNCLPTYTSYFYVDNICVSIDSMDCYSLNNINHNKFYSITIQPNPTLDFLIIKNNSSISFKEISITNILGQKINCKYEVLNNNYKIFLANIENGIYYLSIILNDNSRINKLFLKI